MKICKGVSASPGLVLGQVSRLERHVETFSTGPFDPERELRQLEGAVRTALIGWTPPAPGVTPIVWIGGEVVDFDDNALLFIDSYQLTNLLQK